jgi:hypothetical protein
MLAGTKNITSARTNPLPWVGDEKLRLIRLRRVNIMDIKKITVFRAGGTASVEAEIIPEETVDQLIRLVAPKLGLPEDETYQILGANGSPITGTLYKAVKAGDTVTLARIGKGGSR